MNNVIKYELVHNSFKNDDGQWNVAEVGIITKTEKYKIKSKYNLKKCKSFFGLPTF